MKWLYMIIRLFKCPHKWVVIDRGAVMSGIPYLIKPVQEQADFRRTGSFEVQKCSKCKKLRVQKAKL